MTRCRIFRELNRISSLREPLSTLPTLLIQCSTTKSNALDIIAEAKLIMTKLCAKVYFVTAMLEVLAIKCDNRSKQIIH